MIREEADAKEKLSNPAFTKEIYAYAIPAKHFVNCKEINIVDLFTMEGVVDAYIRLRTNFIKNCTEWFVGGDVGNDAKRIFTEFEDTLPEEVKLLLDIAE